MNKEDKSKVFEIVKEKLDNHEDSIGNKDHLVDGKVSSIVEDILHIASLLQDGKQAKRGLQVRRKDKDLMSDTGGISKNRHRQPDMKPSRKEEGNRHRTKDKPSEERDNDNDNDKDSKKSSQQWNSDLVERWLNRKMAFSNFPKLFANNEFRINRNRGRVPYILYATANDQMLYMGGYGNEVADFMNQNGIPVPPDDYKPIHPLDRFVISEFGIPFPENNYFRKVCSRMISRIESNLGISEKDFHRIDILKSKVESLLRRSKVSTFVLENEIAGKDENLCCEILLDRYLKQ